MLSVQELLYRPVNSFGGFFEFQIKTLCFDNIITS